MFQSLILHHTSLLSVYPQDYFSMDNKIQMQLIDTFLDGLAEPLMQSQAESQLHICGARLGQMRLANRTFKIMSRIPTSIQISMTTTVMAPMNSGGHTRSDIISDLTLFLP